MRYTIYLMIVLILFCCKNSNKNHLLDNDISIEDVYKMNVNDLDQRSTMSIDSLLNSVSYVALETNENSIIGHIDEIVVSNEYIFVLDIFQTESIFIFNRTGKFIRKIHKIGKGPGEYNQPADISIRETNQEILLLNEYPQKIIRYNFQGKFLGEVALPIRFSSLSTMKNGDIILINEPNCRKYGNPIDHPNDIFSRLFLITTKGIENTFGGPINSIYEENTISHTNFGLMKNNNITYYPLFTDTIYQIKGMKPYPYQIVDFGSHSINKQKVAGLSTDEFFEICAQNNFNYIAGQHAQTTDFISFFIYASAQDKSYYTIFNKINKKYIIFRNSESNPLNPCSILPYSAINESFISLPSIAKLNEIKKNIKHASKNISKKDLQFTPSQELLDRIDENSNPVLAFYTLRPEKINAESVYLTKK